MGLMGGLKEMHNRSAPQMSALVLEACIYFEEREGREAWKTQKNLENSATQYTPRGLEIGKQGRVESVGHLTALAIRRLKEAKVRLQGIQGH